MQMKKAAIFSITAFYLLLTTGMFVCVMHCAAEKLFEKPGMQMQMAGSNGSTHQSKHCTYGDDCGCCKNHGSYAVRENLKPGYDLSFAQSVIAVQPVQLPEFLLSSPVYISDHLWQDVNAPPGKSGKSLAIQYRSLLI